MAKQKMVSFGAAIKNFFTKYFDFQGTATRSEYWFVWLALFVSQLIFVVLPLGILETIVWAIVFLPSRALACRRFHDVGLSCWWYLAPMLFFFVFGMIRMDMWMFLLNLEQVPMDLVVMLGLYFVYALGLLVVFVLPSKLKNNKYRSKK